MNVYECPFHKGEKYSNILEYIKHVNDYVEKNGFDLKPVNAPQVDQNHMQTISHDAPARSKSKKRRVYAPNLNEVNMASVASPNAYGGAENNGEEGQNLQFGRDTQGEHTIDPNRRVKYKRPNAMEQLIAHTPKRHRVWTRHFEGAPSYPRGNWLTDPEIRAIKALNEFEQYVITYYDSKIDEVNKAYALSNDDIVLKDKMTLWLYKVFGNMIHKYTPQTLIQIADTYGYLSAFDKVINESQIVKSRYILNNSK